MTDACPVCDEPIADAERVDPVTFVLQPCGHQVDERTYSDLATDEDD